MAENSLVTLGKPATGRKTCLSALLTGYLQPHWPALLGRFSCRFQAGNALTALMNQAGNPDCLLSLVAYDRTHWLAWLAGEGDRFRILPDSLAYRILSSARSQAGRTQPTLLAHGHGRYLFTQPNSFAACLRPQAETQTAGRLEVAGATAAQLQRRLIGDWRNGALG